MAAGDDKPLLDNAFTKAIERSGLRLDDDETAGLAKLAGWLRDGVANLPEGPFIAPPDPDAVLDLSIPELGTRLRDGRLTAVGLVQATLERIAARDGDFRSFYKVLSEDALAAAARADKELSSGQDRGPLHGIPIGIKDLIDVAGAQTTANAPGRRDEVAERDAEVVRRLREAGAIIIGKLATYEWATVGPDSKGLFPPARNPWNLEHITGGSSSGCAAAVAGGLLRTTVGTDTGGSVRGPSFYCGTVGLKPTFGAVSTEGVLDLAPSLDHVGPISASVADAALTFDVLAGQNGERSVVPWLGRSVKSVKVGYARDWFARDPQAMPEVISAMDAAVSTLSQLGMLIEEVPLPDYPTIEVAVAAILHAESFKLHAAQLRDHPEAYGRRAFLSLAAGVAISDAEMERARAEGLRFRNAVDKVLEQHDVIITAGALTTALLAAPFEKEAVWTPMRTIGFNVSGHPVLALPVGFHEGLPIGMQIVGRHGEEGRVLQVGHAFEQASDVSLQKPPRPN